MAKGFVLTAQLVIRGPSTSSISSIVNSINKQLTGITATVNVNVNPAATATLNRQAQAMKNIKTVAHDTRSELQKFGEQSALAIRRFAAFSVATTGFIALAAAMHQAIGEAFKFDKEIVRISQVTGTSIKGLSGLTDEITRLATSLGVSSSKIAGVATILSQAGLSAGDTKVALEALAKTELSATFEDIHDTAEGAIAIMAQFKTSVKDLEGQLSSVNAVAGAFAVESSDLITAVRRTGGAFQAAGGQLNELISLFTSVRATTRESAESIATGFRTIFTRLQRPRTIEFLKTLGIELRTLEGQFVGPYEAIRRLSVALAEIPGTDPRFAQVTEELGGFRQVSKVIPLIKEFATSEKALGIAQRANNSITLDAAKAQNALLVQVQKVKEQFESLFRTIVSNDQFKNVLTTVLKLSTALIKVAESLTKIAPLIVGLSAAKLFQGTGQFLQGFLPGLHNKSYNAATGQYGVKTKKAGGGFVPGAGNSDSVHAMLTPGEFVIRKSAAKAIGADNLNQMNHYAEGGEVKKNRVGRIKKGRKQKVPPFSEEQFAQVEEEIFRKLLEKARVQAQTGVYPTEELKSKVYKEYAAPLLEQLSESPIDTERARRVQQYEAKIEAQIAEGVKPQDLKLFHDAIVSEISMTSEGKPAALGAGPLIPQVAAQNKVVAAKGQTGLSGLLRKKSSATPAIEASTGFTRVNPTPPNKPKDRRGPLGLPYYPNDFGENDEYGIIVDSGKRNRFSSSRGRNAAQKLYNKQSKYDDINSRYKPARKRQSGIIEYDSMFGIGRTVLSPSQIVRNKRHNAVEANKIHNFREAAKIEEYNRQMKQGTTLNLASLSGLESVGQGSKFNINSLSAMEDIERSLNAPVVSAASSTTSGAPGKKGKKTGPTLNKSGQPRKPRVNKITPGIGDSYFAIRPNVDFGGLFVGSLGARDSQFTQTLGQNDLGTPLFTELEKGIKAKESVGDKQFAGVIATGSTNFVGKDGEKLFLDRSREIIVSAIQQLTKDLTGGDAGHSSKVFGNADLTEKLLTSINLPNIQGNLFQSTISAFSGGAGASSKASSIFDFGPEDTNDLQRSMIGKMFSADNLPKYLDAKLTADFSTSSGKNSKGALPDLIQKAISVARSGPGFSIDTSDRALQFLSSSVKQKEAAQKRAEKKAAQKKAAGGAIHGTDTVPAMLTPGEFVVNKQSAQSIGYGNLHKINKYAKGGVVGSIASSAKENPLNAALIGSIAVSTLGDFINLSDGAKELAQNLTSAATQATVFVSAIRAGGQKITDTLTARLEKGKANQKTLVNVEARRKTDVVNKGDISATKFLAAQPELRALGTQATRLSGAIRNIEARLTAAQSRGDTAGEAKFTAARDRTVARQRTVLGRRSDIQDEVSSAATDFKNSRTRLANTTAKKLRLEKQNQETERQLIKNDRVSLGIGVLSGAASAAGNALSDKGNANIKAGNFGTGKTQSVVGGALSTAGQGAAIGAAVGSFIPVIGTATGAIVGALGGMALGIANSADESEKQIAAIKFDKVFDEFTRKLERIQSGEVSAISQAGGVQSGVASLRKRLISTRGDADQTENTKGQITQTLNGLDTFLVGLAKSSQTLDDFKKSSGDVLNFFANFSGSTMAELDKRFGTLIETVQKSKKVQDESIKLESTLNNRLKLFNSLIGKFGDLSVRLDSVTQSFGKFGGQIDNIKVSDSEGVFGRLGSVDNNLLQSELQKVSPQLAGQGGKIGQEAVVANTILKQLPLILSKVAGQGLKGEENFSDSVKTELRNLFANQLPGTSKDIEANTISTILNEIKKEIGGEQKDQIISEAVLRNANDVTEKIANNFKGLSQILIEGKKAIANELNSIAAGLEVHSKLLSDYSNKQIEINQLQLDADIQVRKNENPFTGGVKLEDFFKQDFDKQGALLGKAANVGLENNPQAIGLAARQTQVQLDAAKKNFQNNPNVETQKTVNDLNEHFISLMRTLENLGDTSTRLTNVQTLLSNAEEKRKQLASVQEKAALGGIQERVQLARSAKLAVGVSSGQLDVKSLPRERIKEVLEFLDSLGKNAIAGKQADETASNIRGQLGITQKSDEEKTLQQQLISVYDIGIKAQNELKAAIEQNTIATTNQIKEAKITVKEAEGARLAEVSTANQRDFAKIDQEFRDTETKQLATKVISRDLGVKVDNNDDLKNVKTAVNAAKERKKLTEEQNRINLAANKGVNIGGGVIGTGKENTIDILINQVEKELQSQNLPAESVKGITDAVRNRADTMIADLGNNRFTTTDKAQGSINKIVNENLGTNSGIAKSNREAVAKTQATIDATGVDTHALINNLEDLDIILEKLGDTDIGNFAKSLEELRLAAELVIRSEQENFQARQVNANEQNLLKRNFGGPVPGIGSHDSVPAMLTPGEFVINSNSARRIGISNLTNLNRYARGGTVGLPGNGTTQLPGTGTTDFSSFNDAIVRFSQTSNSLIGAMNNFPHTIDLNAHHTVEVIVNGAEVLSRMVPAIQDLVINGAMDQINKMIKKKIPDVGVMN
jgi:TP901 family phage tail tape measure protein